MARTVRSPKTPEQRKAQAEALQATIAGKVAELREHNGWAAFLAGAAHLYRFSLHNIVLILAQDPAATQVAGFRQWQARGRQVRKGERSIKIFGHSSMRVRRDTGEKAGPEVPDEETIVRDRFPILSVFDVAQTDLIKGTDPVEDAGTASSEVAVVGDPEGIYAAVSGWLAGLGWQVSRGPILMGADGYTTTDGSRQVVIEERLSVEAAVVTLLHEGAHVVLHADDSAGEYVAHRGVKETEAESVAFVLGGVLGMDTTTHSIAYIAGWSQADPAVIEGSAVNVLRAVKEISAGIIVDAA